MANQKEIRFKAVFDDSGMDAGIQKLQQRLAQMQRTSGTIQNIQEKGGTLSPAATQAQKVFQSTSKNILEREKRELEATQRNEMKYLQQKERQLEKLRKIEESLTEAQKKKLKNLEEEVNLRSQKAIQREGQIGEIGDRLGQVSGQDPAGEALKGGGGLKGMMDRMMKAINPRAIASLIGGAATGISMYAGYLGLQQTRERELMSARGGATQGANVGFQSTMQGQGFMNFFEQDERAKAFDAAMKERDIRLQRDPLSAVGSALGKGAAGAVAGGIGGSFIPGLGNVAGAAIGGIGGMASELFNKNTFNMMFDRERYQADVSAEMFNNFRGNLQSQRMMNPEKYAGQEQFGKRQGRFQNLQRMLGMDDQDLLGDNILAPAQRRREGEMSSEERVRGITRFNEKTGKYEIRESDADLAARQEEIDSKNANRQQDFLERNMTDRAGNRAFSEERIMQNLQALQGAGASTEFMRGGGAGMAAEYQRAGYTNAAGELGQLSGLGGDVAETEQAYIRLISEGMRLGINESEMPEETRRFTKMATQLFTETAGSEGAVRVLGQGMVGTDMSSMQAARGMFDRMNQEAGQSTGYRGALKQSFLQSKKGQAAFGGLDENLKQTLTEMDIKSLDVDNPFIREAARQQGVTPEEMIESVRGLQRFGENLSGDTDKARENLTKQFKKSGMSKQEFMKSDEGNSALVKFLSSYGIEREGIGQLNKDQLESLGGYAISGDMTGLKDQMDKMDLSGRGTAADKAEGSKANDQVAQLQIVNDQLKELKSSFDKNLSESIDQLKSVVFNTEKLKLLEQIREEGGDDAVREFFGDLFNVGGNKKNQSTVGKSK